VDVIAPVPRSRQVLSCRRAASRLQGTESYKDLTREKKKRVAEQSCIVPLGGCILAFYGLIVGRPHGGLWRKVFYYYFCATQGDLFFALPAKEGLKSAHSNLDRIGVERKTAQNLANEVDTGRKGVHAWTPSWSRCASFFIFLNGSPAVSAGPIGNWFAARHRRLAGRKSSTCRCLWIGLSKSSAFAFFGEMKFPGKKSQEVQTMHDKSQCLSIVRTDDQLLPPKANKKRGQCPIPETVPNRSQPPAVNAVE
jgi:hypothetical protein